LEFGGFALTNTGSPATDFTTSIVTPTRNSIIQRWIVHSQTDDGNTFTISSAKDGRYIGSHTSLINNDSGAEVYTISYAAGQGYALKKENGKYLTVDETGTVQITSTVTYFEVFSAIYSS
jgi:phospholipase C